jgi:hypothetical protein
VIYDLQIFHWPSGWSHVERGTLAQLNDLHNELQETELVRIRLVSDE